MSDTNITLRSQEFVQRGQMQSQSLRQDSANQMTGGLRDIQQFMQQFALMKAESDAKVQLHEQEMQINAVKLQHMQALDATDLMGEQVRSAKLANDGAEFQLKQQQKMAAQWEGSGMSKLHAEVIDFMGGIEKMTDSGILVDPDTLAFSLMTPEQREDHAKRPQARTAPTYSDLLREREAAYVEADEERVAAIDNILNERRGGQPIQSRSQARPQAAAQPATVPVDPAFAPAVHSIEQVLPDPAQSRAVIGSLWSRRSILVEAANSMRDKENHPQPFTEQEAFDMFVEAASSYPHPRHAQAAAFIQALTGISLKPSPQMPPPPPPRTLGY